ncbi:hypothetical protein MMC26_000578 [Xylographa opegraphella]|nr:hypothetical protein [Xylographa opegraphella]
MENDTHGNDDAYDYGAFEIDPETESAVDPEPAPRHTIYHNPLGGFTIPSPLPAYSYNFNHNFLKSKGPNLKQNQFPQAQEPVSESIICQEDHYPHVPILVTPTFGKGTGLEEIKGAREAFMIAPSCGLAKLKETLRHTFFENRFYQEGGNLKSGKEPPVPIVSIKVKQIRVKGLGISMVVHEGNVEALLALVGRRAPEMSLHVTFVKIA